MITRTSYFTALVLSFLLACQGVPIVAPINDDGAKANTNLSVEDGWALSVCSGTTGSSAVASANSSGPCLGAASGAVSACAYTNGNSTTELDDDCINALIATTESCGVTWDEAWGAVAGCLTSADPYACIEEAVNDWLGDDGGGSGGGGSGGGGSGGGGSGGGGSGDDVGLYCHNLCSNHSDTTGYLICYDLCMGTNAQ